MKKAMPILLLTLLFALSATAQTPSKPAHPLAWKPWSQQAFDQAKRENRFVLLDLEAVWCHWCHVMDETTYKDPEVTRLLDSRYLLVKVDQDSRPDLSNRYEDFGWPATIVFAPDGGEIVKRQGYIAPDEMVAMLKAIIADPTPGPSVQPEAKLDYPANAVLSAALKKDLHDDYLDGFDNKRGSWGFSQKFLDWDSVEYSMVLAQTGDRQAEKMARDTLHAQLRLLDPAWGGVYQYSTDGDWVHPHFEKIMQMQAENLRIYALAYAQWHDPEYLRAATEIHRFLKTFLTAPNGAFYVSQDADLKEGQHSAAYFALNDAARRKLGVPRVDQHLYARENGWMIAALATLYGATGDHEYVDEAVRSANWVSQNRALRGGGFRHDVGSASDAAGPYLGDNAAMLRAFVALYTVTGDRRWLARAESVATYIDKTFRDSSGAGYQTAVSSSKASKPRPQRDENILVLRSANLLQFYSGSDTYRGIAARAMRYLAAESVAKRLPAASVLLADREFTSPPLHLTVVGLKDDPAARQLFQAAAAYAYSFKRLEWWDSREGRLPNPDVNYPQLARAALFICTNRTCSPPIYDATQARAKIDRLVAPNTGAAPLTDTPGANN